METPRQSKWWGSFPLAEGELGRWRIGPLDFWVQRTDLDWRYGSANSNDPLESSLEVLAPAAIDPETHELPKESARFGCSRTESSIEVMPALADRPVVTRPATPFFLPPHQKVELFVSTPLWLRLRARKVDLVEIPCTRPSDTWFGSNTQGTLCYASRTHLLRRLEHLPLRPHRAVTGLRVENATDRVLALERLSLPVPQLSLFESPSGTLWTEQVSVAYEEGEALAAVTLGAGPPRVAGECRSVSKPREPRGRSFGSLVFGGLFQTAF